MILLAVVLKLRGRLVCSHLQCHRSANAAPLSAASEHRAPAFRVPTARDGRRGRLVAGPAGVGCVGGTSMASHQRGSVDSQSREAARSRREPQSPSIVPGWQRRSSAPPVPIQSTIGPRHAGGAAEFLGGQSCRCSPRRPGVRRSERLSTRADAVGPASFLRNSRWKHTHGIVSRRSFDVFVRANFRVDSLRAGVTRCPDRSSPPQALGTHPTQEALLALMRGLADAELVAEEARCRLCETRSFDPTTAFACLKAHGC